MSLHESIVQPASFAWELDPQGILSHIPRETVVSEARPLIDWISPLIDEPMLDQIKAIAKPVEIHAFALPRIVLARLSWRGETLDIFYHKRFLLTNAHHRRTFFGRFA